MATLIEFLSLWILKIQYFPKLLEIVNQCPMLLLFKIGASAKAGSGMYFYQHLFLEFRKFTREISTWKCYLNKIGSLRFSVKKHFYSVLILGNAQNSRKNFRSNTSDWLFRNLKIIEVIKNPCRSNKFLENSLEFLKMKLIMRQ